MADYGWIQIAHLCYLFPLMGWDQSQQEVQTWRVFLGELAESACCTAVVVLPSLQYTCPGLDRSISWLLGKHLAQVGTCRLHFTWSRWTIQASTWTAVKTYTEHFKWRQSCVFNQQRLTEYHLWLKKCQHKGDAIWALRSQSFSEQRRRRRPPWADPHGRGQRRRPGCLTGCFCRTHAANHRAACASGPWVTEGPWWPRQSLSAVPPGCHECIPAVGKKISPLIMLGWNLNFRGQKQYVKYTRDSRNYKMVENLCNLWKSCIVSSCSILSRALVSNRPSHWPWTQSKNKKKNAVLLFWKL